MPRKSTISVRVRKLRSVKRRKVSCRSVGGGLRRSLHVNRVVVSVS